MLTFFQGWTNAYAYSLRLYNARVDSYRKGNIIAKDMSDAEATMYADQNGIGMPPLADPTHTNGAVHHEPLDQAIPDLMIEPEVEPEALAEPELDDVDEDHTAPTPKKPARKRKGAEAEPVDPTSPANKKARRTTKAGDETPEAKKPVRKRNAKV